MNKLDYFTCLLSFYDKICCLYIVTGHHFELEFVIVIRCMKSYLSQELGLFFLCSGFNRNCSRILVPILLTRCVFFLNTVEDGSSQNSSLISIPVFSGRFSIVTSGIHSRLVSSQLPSFERSASCLLESGSFNELWWLLKWLLDVYIFNFRFLLYVIIQQFWTEMKLMPCSGKFSITLGCLAPLIKRGILFFFI